FRISDLSCRNRPISKFSLAEQGGAQLNSPQTFRRSDHPVCAASVASHLLFMPHPPLLLRGGETIRHLAAAGAGALMRASSQCSLIKLFSMRTTSKWFHLYSRLGSSGSLAVRSYIMNEYGPLISVRTGALTHS